MRRGTEDAFFAFECWPARQHSSTLCDWQRVSVRWMSLDGCRSMDVARWMSLDGCRSMDVAPWMSLHGCRSMDVARWTRERLVLIVNGASVGRRHTFASVVAAGRTLFASMSGKSGMDLNCPPARPPDNKATGPTFRAAITTVFFPSPTRQGHRRDHHRILGQPK